VQVVTRVAWRPCRALGVEGPAPRQAGSLPPRVREPHTPLVVGAAMARSQLRFGAARCGGHADVALPSWGHDVMRSVPSESS
jgi:hypothetical protein